MQDKQLNSSQKTILGQYFEVYIEPNLERMKTALGHDLTKALLCASMIVEPSKFLELIDELYPSNTSNGKAREWLKDFNAILKGTVPANHDILKQILQSPKINRSSPLNTAPSGPTAAKLVSDYVCSELLRDWLMDNGFSSITRHTQRDSRIDASIKSKI